jgi:HSP20 family protein
MFGTLVPQRRGLRRRGPASGLLEEVEDLIGRVWEGREDGWSFGYEVPSLDIAETDRTVEAKLDLPGVKPKEIDIQLNGNMLTVSGERKEEKDEKGKTYHRVERRCGNFSRSITLPCAVQEDEVAAEFRDGVLTITLPKTEEAKTRKIAVKS